MKLKLILLFFKKNKIRSFFLIFIFFIIILTIITSLFIIQNSKNFLEKNAIAIKNDKTIIIQSKEKTSFLDKKNKDLNNFYKNLKTDKNLQNLKAYFFPKIPTSLIINLIWKNLETDVFLYFTEEKNYLKKEENYIPLEISQKFLNIYNLELAWNSFFPKINKKNISFLDLKLCLNKSSFFSLWESVCKKAKITKTSNFSPLIWISLDKKILEKYLKNNEKLIKKINRAKIIKIVAKVKNKNYIKILKKKIIWKNIKILTLEEEKSNMNKKLNIYFYIIFFISFFIILLNFLFLYYIIFSYFETEKNIFLLFFYDWISNKKIFFIWFNYFTFIFFISSFLSFIFLNILNYFIIPFLNQIIKNSFNIIYIFEKIKIEIFFLILFVIFLILSFIYSIIFFKKQKN